MKNEDNIRECMRTLSEKKHSKIIFSWQSDRKMLHTISLFYSVVGERFFFSIEISSLLHGLYRVFRGAFHYYYFLFCGRIKIPIKCTRLKIKWSVVVDDSVVYE